jgi:hypothetical protein
MFDLLTNTKRETPGPVQLGLQLTPHSTIALTSPPWIRSVTNRVDYLLALGDNWDGNGSQALDFECAMEVINFLLSAAAHETPEPYLVPTSSRGVQVEWHIAGIDLEITFEPTNSATYFYLGTDDVEREGEVAQDNSLVASLIRGLPARNERPHTTR